MANLPQQDACALHQIKGVMARFMRMLFPVNFRIDTVSDCPPILALRYPLTAGEMIYLPERVEGFGGAGDAYRYYVVTAAHLAGRHEFGTFDFRLADLPGFEERSETGVEALDGYVASFEDPALAGTLLRICESARIDAELSRHYRGLAPHLANINQLLAAEMPATALGTMLVRAALGLEAPAQCPPAMAALMGLVEGFFAPLRAQGATISTAVQQTGKLYAWFKELIAAAQPGSDSDELSPQAEELMRSLEDLGGQQRQNQGAGAKSEGQTSLDAKAESRSDPTSKEQGARALSPEEVGKLLEEGAQLETAQTTGKTEGVAMYLTQLLGKERLDELRHQLAEAGQASSGGRLVIGESREDSYYAYDEWDYLLNDYRRSWCRLREIVPGGDAGDFFARTLERYAELLPQVRRHFQRIRPASYRMVKGLEDGEDIDFNRMVENRVQRLLGSIPDGRVYKARKKEARDVSTLFLLDMSASTDEPIPSETRRYTELDRDDWLKTWQRRSGGAQRPRRVIDVNKEALVIMAQALEELGDAYAIMGFSGHGRDNVEFYTIKEFDQELSYEVKARVGAVEPKRSTRMGAALRHAREKFRTVTSRAKHLILLSDGFPQDFDYGHDRRSNFYGIQDTMVALKELELAGVLPFCVTVDRTGHDYLRQMCSASRYLVIDDLNALPRQLPKIYEQVVRW